MQAIDSIFGFGLTIFCIIGGIRSICRDDIFTLKCKQRAMDGLCQGWGGGDIFLEAIAMLSDCRKSCQEVLQNLTDVPEIVRIFGGVDEEIIDQFGFSRNICDEEQFFSPTRRGFLDDIAVANIQPEWVPKFTQIGFAKSKIPMEIYSKILVEYHHNDNLRIGLHNMEAEECLITADECQSIISEEDKCKVFINQRNYIIGISNGIVEEILAEIWPLVEEWVGFKLEPSSFYGIRRYTNQSFLNSHVDSLSEHVIGVILNIEQDVEEEWPLYIKDNFGNSHSLLLQPGEMIMYEGARLSHGRQKPLNGKYYDNLLIHFIPATVWYEHNMEVGTKPRELPITIQEILDKQHLEPPTKFTLKFV